MTHPMVQIYLGRSNNMKSISGNALKRLGKRLRDDTATDEDIVLLEHYRRSFDPILLEVHADISAAITEAKAQFLITGRSKRTKSIRRKLLRPQNRGMDLSRMADMVGVRIIVRDREIQDNIISLLSELYPEAQCRDYRETESGRIYHAVHLIVNKENMPVEVQLRTIPQHLWADEAESFGEQVKEGTMDGKVEEYLTELSKLVEKYENGEVVDQKELVSTIVASRSPINHRLPNLYQNFDEAVNDASKKQEYTYLCVHDARTNELTRETRYNSDERDEAITDYEHLSKELPEDLFDILLLNTSINSALKVTHPSILGY
jgi:ppGpp synthetase/RelA/SpoT-type nucleotidyltranferase